MVRLTLSIKADLENVTNLAPADASFEYFVQVKCSSCHETHPNFVSLNRVVRPILLRASGRAYLTMHPVSQEEREVSGGKNATAHFVWRCSFCKREHSAKFEPNVEPKAYSIDYNGDFAPLVTLDCRGLEFTGFDPRGTWKCEGAESGTKFPEVDLTEGEWVDYDEKASVPVSVMNIESRWARA